MAEEGDKKRTQTSKRTKKESGVKKGLAKPCRRALCASGLIRFAFDSLRGPPPTQTDRRTISLGRSSERVPRAGQVQDRETS